MAFVDELHIEARAGNGGNGVVRWLHLKGIEYAGPSGGNGGSGGDVYIRGVDDLNLLARYRGEKKFQAEHGEDGGNRNKDGKSGNDLVIDVPVGAVVRNLSTGEVVDVLISGEQHLILKGGRGGAGNAAFKSSVNRSPTESTVGGRGERAKLHIELRLIAAGGLIGLPNAGKSSLLNALTGASAKVGAYEFTTLDPNLGVFYGHVLADIPGLIEGASEGKGLGMQFLRHIARTRLLLHCVSLESDTPLEDYRTVRTELEQFEGGALAQRPELVILTKSDTRDTIEIQKVLGMFAASGVRATVVTILDDSSVKVLRDLISATLE